MTTHRVLKSHRSKTGVIYMCNHENNVPSRLSPSVKFILEKNNLNFDNEYFNQIKGTPMGTIFAYQWEFLSSRFTIFVEINLGKI